MALYATASELASYLQQDLDTSTATLALTTASALFAREADTAFTATTTTWVTTGGAGTDIELPFRPVTAVSAVRLNGVVITGWTLRANALWRSAGFGTYYAFPPDELAVDLTYGYTSVPDDVKQAVLEMAAGVYHNPTGAISETIDDYTVRFAASSSGGGFTGSTWRDVARNYRGPLVA